MSLADDPNWFQRGYYRRVEVALVIAAVVHAGVFWLAPPYVPSPYKLASPSLRLVSAEIAAGGEANPAPARVPPLEATRGERSGGAPVVTEQLRLPPPASPAAPGAGAAGVGFGVGESEPPVFYAFDSPPKPTRRVEPDYPPMAMELGAQGTVVVNANVDERGRVVRAWVAQSTAPEILVQTALDAVYQFEFAPGSAHGIPVKCTVAIPFSFSLKQHL